MRNHGLYHVPDPVEIQPSPTGLSALIFVPFVGLLIGLAIWRAFNRVRRSRWERT